MTREPGNLPERRHPSGVRRARMGRSSAAVTGDLSSGGSDRRGYIVETDVSEEFVHHRAYRPSREDRRRPRDYCRGQPFALDKFASHIAGKAIAWVAACSVASSFCHCVASAHKRLLKTSRNRSRPPPANPRRPTRSSRRPRRPRREGPKFQPSPSPPRARSPLANPGRRRRDRLRQRRPRCLRPFRLGRRRPTQQVLPTQPGVERWYR
jgi:hypothetical protein